MDVADGGHKPRRMLLASLLVSVVLAGAGLLVWRQTAHRSTGVLKPGSEVEVAKMNPYGWSASLAVGTRFTDGLNFIPLSLAAKGPLRLLSVQPVMDSGQTLKVLGVLARITPAMLPPNFQTGWFESANNFPPTDHDASGGVNPVGLVVPVPTADETQIELQIGYEVVAPGTSNKLGVRVRYEYQGRTHEVMVPSHLTVCAPAKVKCAAEGND